MTICFEQIVKEYRKKYDEYNKMSYKEIHKESKESAKGRLEYRKDGLKFMRRWFRK